MSFGGILTVLPAIWLGHSVEMAALPALRLGHRLEVAVLPAFRLVHRPYCKQYALLNRRNGGKTAISTLLTRRNGGKTAISTLFTRQIGGKTVKIPPKPTSSNVKIGQNTEKPRPYLPGQSIKRGVQ